MKQLGVTLIRHFAASMFSKIQKSHKYKHGRITFHMTVFYKNN